MKSSFKDILSSLELSSFQTEAYENMEKEKGRKVAVKRLLEEMRRRTASICGEDPDCQAYNEKKLGRLRKFSEKDK